MTPKRAVLLLAGGSALAAWIAGAATSDLRQPPPAPSRAAPVDARAAQLAADVARLHSWSRPPAAPRHPGRNLFTFAPSEPAPRQAPAEAAAPPAPPAPTVATPPDLVLDGIAEDAGPDGPVRTAIIAGDGQLFLVRQGDAVTSRFTVLRVGAEAVELADRESGTTLRLALR
jgi:hypothetical protein